MFHECVNTTLSYPASMKSWKHECVNSGESGWPIGSEPHLDTDDPQPYSSATIDGFFSSTSSFSRHKSTTVSQNRTKYWLAYALTSVVPFIMRPSRCGGPRDQESGRGLPGPDIFTWPPEKNDATICRSHVPWSARISWGAPLQMLCVSRPAEAIATRLSGKLRSQSSWRWGKAGRPLRRELWKIIRSSPRFL